MTPAAAPCGAIRWRVWDGCFHVGFLALELPGIAIFAGPPFLVMLIAAQLGRRRIAVAIGLLGTALILYATIDTYVVCNAPMQWRMMKRPATSRSAFSLESSYGLLGQSI
jgi:hypothetical protein